MFANGARYTAEPCSPRSSRPATGSDSLAPRLVQSSLAACLVQPRAASSLTARLVLPCSSSRPAFPGSSSRSLALVSSPCGTVFHTKYSLTAHFSQMMKMPIQNNPYRHDIGRKG